MKILLVNNMAPFVWGGAEELAVNLQKQLILAGHQAEIMRIPFQWEPAERIPSQMLMVRALELYNVDRVIAFKFPAYLIRHPHKTLWMVHQYRQAYDLWDAGQSNLPDTEEGRAIRDCIVQADNSCFGECKNIYAISEVTRERLLKYNNIISTVLELPVNDEVLFQNMGYGEYIFVSGRVNKMKRQDLLLKALALTKNPVHLRIAGPPDSSEDRSRLEELVERLGLYQRASLDLRFLSRDEYIENVNNALAVAAIPYNEEYGYVAREAACAEKSIIATSDSGGILKMVHHGKTGLVAEPTPEALAEALDTIWENRDSASRFGCNANELWKSMRINWSSVLGALLQ